MSSDLPTGELPEIVQRDLRAPAPEEKRLGADPAGVAVWTRRPRAASTLRPSSLKTADTTGGWTSPWRPASVLPRSTGGADAEAADLTARLPPPPVHVWVFVLILFALGTVLSWWAIGGG